MQISGASRRENADVHLPFEIQIETLNPSLLRCARNDVDGPNPDY